MWLYILVFTRWLCSISGVFLPPGDSVDAATGFEFRSDLHTMFVWDRWRESEVEDVTHHCFTPLPPRNTNRYTWRKTHACIFWTANASTIQAHGGRTSSNAITVQYRLSFVDAGWVRIQWSLITVQYGLSFVDATWLRIQWSLITISIRSIGPSNHCCHNSL